MSSEYFAMRTSVNDHNVTLTITGEMLNPSNTGRSIQVKWTMNGYCEGMANLAHRGLGCGPHYCY
ncbi:MAG TPA: hypothetical protein VGJ66_14500 [Pyrinomonadaceae bacterium]|jgi:hypothetical protein